MHAVEPSGVVTYKNEYYFFPAGFNKFKIIGVFQEGIIEEYKHIGPL